MKLAARGVRRCSWRRRISKDGVHGARCGARSSRGRADGGVGSTAAGVGGLLPQSRPSSIRGRRRLLLPAAVFSSPARAKPTATGPRRRPPPFSPSLPWRVNAGPPPPPSLSALTLLSFLLPILSTAMALAAWAEHGRRRGCVLPPPPSPPPLRPAMRRCSSAARRRACCPVAGRRQLLCPGSRAGSSGLASLLRAEPSLLNELAKGPSRTEPSRAWLGSARFQP